MNIFVLDGRQLEIVDYTAPGDYFDAAIDLAVWVDTNEELSEQDYRDFYHVYPEWLNLLRYEEAL